MRISKKIVAIALSVLMAVSMMPFTVFAAGLPTATVTDITAETEFDKAYKFEANNDGAAYNDYFADYIVTVDKPIDTSEVELWGKIGDSEWIQFPAMQAEAGVKYYLARDAFQWTPTYAEILDQMSSFSCAVKGLAATETKMDVQLVIYKEGEEPIEINKFDYQIPGASALPTATVTDITAETEFDKAYKFEANNDGAAYNDYYADYIVTVDKPIDTSEVELWGKIGDSEWIQFPAMQAEAGVKYYLARDAFQWTPTYAEILDQMSSFSCAVKGLAATETKMDVQLVIYKEGEEPIEINKFDYQIPGASALPTATIEPISDDNLDAAYKFIADTTDTNSAYKNYFADFVVSFDKAIDAGDVILSGKYEGYDWTDIDLPALAANEEYRILANNGMGDVTYNDVVTIVKEFMCGAIGVNAEGVTMNVALNIYAAADSEPINIASKSYTFAADKMSITVDEKVDLNIYVADNADDIAKIRLTYNSTPDKEADTQTSVTENADDLKNASDEVVVKVDLAPAQIRDNITVEGLDANGNVVKTIETSVADYCEAILAGNFSAKLKDLAKSTLDYGKAASDYFSYNTADFAGYANQLGAFDASSIALASNAVSGLSISSVSYRATSVPELRFVVTNLTEAEAAELNDSIALTGSTNAKAKFVKLANGTIILQITNIPITEFANQLTVSGDGFSLSYTPLKWVIAAQSNAVLSDLANAIGNYYAKSVAYFG